MENPALEWDAVLEMHATRTEERILQYQPKVALCLQDTTELDACPELVEGSAASRG